jgi:hypothetical protein
MTSIKTIPTESSVLDFINAVDDNQKRADSFALIDILKEISGYQPVMWGASIIGFGSYHYKYASGHEGDWALLGFSPRKSAISLYIYSECANSAELLPLLGKFKMGKACIYIKKLSDINVQVMKQIAQNTLEHLAKTHTVNP